MVRASERGFTLIEMSMVLVIIGLIVGGILVGQELIKAAQVRATISQIQNYKTAVNTFYGKYGYLPGDILPSLATQFGLTPAPIGGNCAGNGLIDDFWCHSPTPYTISGEATAFWVNLSSDTGMIAGSYVLAGPGGSNNSIILGTNVPVLPIGGGVAVQQDGAGQNWFGTGVQARPGDTYAYNYPQALTPSDAYSIDAKIDDGMPNTGGVQASLLTGGAQDVASPLQSTATNCASDGTAANTPAAVYQQQNKSFRCNLRFLIK